MTEMEGGGLGPQIVQFTPEGKARWAEHYDALAAEMNGDGFHPSFRGTCGKYREYAGRLALILACLKHAADPSADPASVPSVGPRVADDAWKLITYFKSHAVRVHAIIARGLGVGSGPAVKALVEWVRAVGRQSFSVREVKQARRWITPTDLSDALKYLAERNVIRPLSGKPRGPAGGRPPSPAYEVNPPLLATRNP